MVTKFDVINDFKALGITSKDILLVHSSLKSFGYVDGGAKIVIDGLREVVSDGTLVFPALRSREFYNAYRDWDINKTPSDVGFLSETFRLMEGVSRSDQETHSVCAIGKDAEYITNGHRSGKPRYCIFGHYAFGHNSPWQRMYDLNAKVVMIGVTMVYNTFKHFVECLVVEDILDKLDNNEREKAVLELATFSDKKPPEDADPDQKPDGVWFWHSGQKTQDKMQELGLLRQGYCGNAKLVLFNVREFVGYLYRELMENPGEWLQCDAVDWMKKYMRINYDNRYTFTRL